MPHTMTLPVIAGLAVIGAAAGVELGRATLAEVPATYFQDQEGSRFFADAAPNRRADWAQVSAAEYQQQTSAPPPQTSAAAVNWPIATPPVHDPQVDRALAEAWREARAPAPEVRYVRTTVYEEPREVRDDGTRARVRRYSTYPVTREEAAPPPDAPDPAGLPDEGDAATQ